MDIVVFDKTGTLTLGRPTVLGCNLLDDSIALPQLCRLMAAAESASEHPLGKAILDYCSTSLVTHSGLTGGTQSYGEPSGLSPRLPVSHSAHSAGGGSSSQQIQMPPWPPSRPSRGSSAGDMTHKPASDGGIPVPVLKLFPSAHDVQVSQGLGISCWVDANEAGLDGHHLLRFAPPAQQSAIASSSSQGPSGSHGGSAAGRDVSVTSSSSALDRVLVIVGNRLMMQGHGVRLPEVLDDLVAPEVGRPQRGGDCVLSVDGEGLREGIVCLLEALDGIQRPSS